MKIIAIGNIDSGTVYSQLKTFLEGCYVRASFCVWGEYIKIFIASLSYYLFFAYFLLYLDFFQFYSKYCNKLRRNLFTKHKVLKLISKSPVLKQIPKKMKSTFIKD